VVVRCWCEGVNGVNETGGEGQRRYESV
jgi:hypothetical protein